MTVATIVAVSIAAYSAPELYAAATASDGGGGGRFFTGSRADGFVCSVCHVGGAAPTVTLEGLPIGAYEPGAAYTFDLRVDPGQRPAVALTAEVVDAAGLGMGRLRMAPMELLTPEELCGGGGRGGAIFEVDDGRTIAALADCRATRLRVQWTAPAAGVGRAYVHVAAVAADGEGTPDDDGVTVLARDVAELGAAQDGCNMAGRGGLMGFLIVVAWRWFLRVVAVVGVAVGVSGCARVKPYERGRLAQPDMKLEQDADISAGQLHATEYREGSVGGEGGGGGGCGCN